jgi:ribosomal protein L11 methyltransferase
VTVGATQFRVTIDAADSDAARSITGLLGEIFEPAPLAVTQFENGLTAHRVDAYFEDAPDLVALQEALDDLGKPGISGVRIEPVPDENWVMLSQAALPPVEAGRFTVHGSHDARRIGRRLNAILIDAGEAFGTAHHATTQGCLEAIDRLTRSQRFDRVLDLGCGSGVLAIAAARAMPSAVILASDIDAIATDVARKNIIANGEGSRIGVVTSVGFDHPRLRHAQAFDLVIANILARPLIRLAPDMRRALVRSGHVVLSGLLSVQAAEVIAAYRAQGFRVARRTDLAGWSTLTLISG